MSHSHNESWFWSPIPTSLIAVFWSQHCALLEEVMVVSALCVVYGPLEAPLTVF